MLVVVVITLMAALVVGSSWPAVLDWRRATAGDGDRDRAAAPGPPGPAESLEGVLVRQVIAHEITPRQYRNAMRRLAERDADRHPMPGLPGDAPPG
ncbi:hypothetical protein COUCH_22310 [Couchioplanes caeruleus]|uniref:hypothetical protein n=1 Tax=Couchioplanes caeruleus TaxID=56438 RepID=UPI0020C07DC9|nr:hypothetical protein [Couchioplanes caeruleus]UQU61774.1 hypothetical protein COUCH_22310 [Couchioplanes caeruleus]